MGPNAAGCGRASLQATLSVPVVTVLASGTQSLVGEGLNTTGQIATDGVLNNSNLWSGPNAAGVSRNNPGPNVAGANRSITDVIL